MNVSLVMHLRLVKKLSQPFALSLLVIGLLAVCARLAIPQEKEPPATKKDDNLRFYQREPYEELRVLEANNKDIIVVKIRPLNL